MTNWDENNVGAPGVAAKHAETRHCWASVQVHKSLGKKEVQ